METILTAETRQKLTAIEDKKLLISMRIMKLANTGNREKQQSASRCKQDIVAIKLMHELKSYQNNFTKV